MPAILLYVLPIVFMFAVLDARYLHLEKGFRRKYDSLRGKDMVVATDFDLAPELDGKSFDPSTLFSWSVLWFYGPMVLLLVLLYFVM